MKDSRRDAAIQRRRHERDGETVGERMLEGCHNCRTPAPLQMTSFTKSYFTRGYKGHTAFRTSHRLQGMATALWVLILLLTEKWPLANRGSPFLTVCNNKDFVRLQLLLRVGAVAIFKRNYICMCQKGDRRGVKA